LKYIAVSFFDMNTRTTILSPAIFFSLLSMAFLPGNFHLEAAIGSPVKTLKSEAAIEYSIIVSKKNYELKVYDSEGWYATYPCVFGSSDLRDKFMEGDKRTPEGDFRVVLKKIHPKWGYELLLDYPNEESVQKFNTRKSKGIVPRYARIGGGIAIHATRPQEEWTVDYFQNWTDGCVSLKYSEAKDLYSYIPVGTPVTIEK
jgi:murein L,D-transpeptidase YafK